ncbi:MAG: hypothetical protein ACFFE2_12370 [Candidatus Thorarchaeota archaeon]
MSISTSESPVIIYEPEWNVIKGSLLTYEINVTGDRDELNGLYSYQWVHLNNTRIIVNVTYLPNLVEFYTSENFILDVVDVQKVVCCFENGTSLSESDSFVSTLISRALLPVSSWKNFDSMFPDHFSGQWEMYEPNYSWVAGFEGDRFFFGYLGESWHFSRGWSAQIELTSGIPYRIENHDNYHDYGFTTDIIELTLVD